MSAQHKTTAMIVLVLLAILVEALGQAPCGCAPQPTIIQLSCNGQGVGYPASPAPAPATDFNVNPTSSHIEEETTSNNVENEVTTLASTDFDEAWCNRDEEGRPTGNPVGGFPEGFRWLQSCAGECSCEHPSVWLGNNNNNQRMPYMNWNGDLAALDFDIGKPGEPTYNMVMCWPVRVPSSGCEQWAPWIANYRDT